MCPNRCELLSRTSVEGIPLEWCASCGGVWFDETEFAQAIQKLEPNETKDGLQASDALYIPDLIYVLLLLLK
jgi:Zn-finger nucleic acid-binding protein